MDRSGSGYDRLSKAREAVRREAFLLADEISLGDLFSRLAELLRDFIDAPVIEIFTGAEGDSSVERVFRDAPANAQDDETAVRSEATALRVLSVGAPALHLSDAAWPGASAIFAPIRFGGNVTGVLTVQSPRESAYDDYDVAMIEECALRLGVRIHDESAQYAADVASKDALTGLETRRGFDEALIAAWRRCARSKTKLAMVMIDVDFFKKFNDTYGHVRGDRALRLVAEAIAASVHRPDDLAARYGGEEFVVMLPATDLSGAIEVAEAICTRVRAAGLKHEGTSHGGVTISAGVACVVPSADGSPTQLVESADGMLYEAKRSGRNRVVAEGHVSKSLAVYSRTIARHNLPAYLTRFVGRETEISELTEALSGSRLASIVGPGGIGKTRLAIELANRMLESHDDGVWFVDFSPITDPKMLPMTVAAAAGLDMQGDPEPSDALVTALQAKRALLVFDNCEHLIDDIAPLVEVLARSSRELRIVATSREPLALSGESIYRLAPLGQEAAAGIFCDRAKASNRDFDPSPKDIATIDAICARLECIPLAVEMAAAQAHRMPLDDIAQQLDRSILSLAGAQRSGYPRQRTLRATIAWSYDLLTEMERALLRRLAVFAGRFSMTSAVEVCIVDKRDRPDAVEVLVRLVEKSLLQPDAAGDKRRYRMLDSTKAFCRQQLEESNEIGMMRLRHAEHFLRVAEQAQAQGRYAEFHADVAHEYPEYRQALQWALSQRHDVLVGARLTASLNPYWEERGQWREGRFWCERVLECGETTELPAAVRAAAFLGLSAHLYVAGEYALMASVSEQAEEAYARTGDVRGQMRSRYVHALASQYAGAFGIAHDLYESALKTSREIGDRAMESSALCNLAWLTTIWKLDYQRAEGLYAQAVEIDRERGASHVLPLLLGDWSQTAAYEGAYERAERLAEESLSLLRAVGDDMRVIEQLVRLGSYQTSSGRLEQAAGTLREALDRLRITTHPLYCAGFFDACAQFALAGGQAEPATELLAFNATWRRKKNLPYHAPDVARTQSSIENVKELLGAAFAAAWNAGTSSTLESAFERGARLLETG